MPTFSSSLSLARSGSCRPPRYAYAGAFTEYRSELDTRSLNIALHSLARGCRICSPKARRTPFYASLVEKEQQLKTLALLTTENTVVRPGLGGSDRASSSSWALLGGILCLVLGLGIALLWETLDKRVRSEAEIEDTIAVPVRRGSGSRTAGFAATAASPRFTSRTRLRPSVSNLRRRSSSQTSSSGSFDPGYERGQREGSRPRSRTSRPPLLSPADASSWLTSISANPRSQRSSGARGSRVSRRSSEGRRRSDEALVSVAMPEVEFAPSARGTRGARTVTIPRMLTLEVLAAGIRLPSDPSQFVAQPRTRRSARATQGSG